MGELGPEESPQTGPFEGADADQLESGQGSACPYHAGVSDQDRQGEIEDQR